MAATGGCYGSECAGLDPAGMCDGDAITVASQAITTYHGYAGQLELRYSPSCAANWGRFAPARGATEAARVLLGAPVPAFGRVTVWNPNGHSQGWAQRASWPWESDWTNMVDGTIKACTGVEVFYSTGRGSGGSGSEATGWNWGPCF